MHCPGKGARRRCSTTTTTTRFPLRGQVIISRPIDLVCFLAHGDRARLECFLLLPHASFNVVKIGFFFSLCCCVSCVPTASVSSLQRIRVATRRWRTRGRAPLSWGAVVMRACPSPLRRWAAGARLVPRKMTPLAVPRVSLPCHQRNPRTARKNQVYSQANYFCPLSC
jgi:hypothetical protein